MSTTKMTLQLVEEMINNYRTKQYVSITNNPAIPMTFDAQSVWFDLESLKNFIKTIEEETALHPDYKMHNFGMRFYYSAYPNTDTWNDASHEEISSLNPHYGKLHTLIAVPTAEINGVNSDFDPFDVSTYDGTKPSGAGISIMAENHGNLTPPNPNAGTWF